MGKNDPRVDAYIANSQPFAKPILTHLRRLVHQACPKVQETITWGFPHFIYRGILCSMASFKKHAVFGFWKEKFLLGTDPGSKGAMGSFGKLTTLSDLPGDKTLISLIKKAMQLNDEGVPDHIVQTNTTPNSHVFQDGVEERHKSARHVRRLQLQQQERLCGMGHRGENGRDAIQASCHCARMDG
jgi:hypothetical protein